MGVASYYVFEPYDGKTACAAAACSLDAQDCAPVHYRCRTVICLLSWENVGCEPKAQAGPASFVERRRPLQGVKSLFGAASVQAP